MENVYLKYEYISEVNCITIEMQFNKNKNK
jgi:hypothetical protein